MVQHMGVGHSCGQIRHLSAIGHVASPQRPSHLLTRLVRLLYKFEKPTQSGRPLPFLRILWSPGIHHLFVEVTPRLAIPHRFPFSLAAIAQVLRERDFERLALPSAQALSIDEMSRIARKLGGDGKRKAIGLKRFIKLRERFIY